MEMEFSALSIRYDHEGFEGRAKYDFFDPLDVLTGSNQQGRDCQGHGTHVAALVAGKTFGAAKGATLYSTRVLACNGRASYGPVLLGIDHVIQQQIARRDKKVIINMSLGGPISFSLHEAISQATEEGILVVVAAGNNIDDACSFSPGSSPDVLTVGGTRRNDDLYLRPFDGTNYGRCVDIFAPGQDITSAGLSRPDAVATSSGTSQATPLVSGAAAIYWSVNKIATPLEVKDAIISTCTRDKLNIDAVVPPSYQGQSPNCLLNINPHQMFGQSGKKENSTHKVFTSVPSADLHSLIADMENKSFALTYIHSHISDSYYHYSLIFKYMADWNPKP
ncbi:extracellular serine proteinase-like [Dysidea avara]|uniref:extracellular serine proteinase-like n=1 Tax=Dysidea avara TaxID=196820 RepID=UPI00333447F8